MFLPDDPEEIVALDVGQTEIEDENIDVLSVQDRESRAPARSFQHVISLSRQSNAQEPPDRRLVVGHANPDGNAHATFSRLVSCAGAAGMVSVKTAPLRSLRLEASSRPPMASARPRAMASPRPVP